jgi:GABA permease
MTPEERANLKLKVWLFPWLNIILIAGAVGIVTIMMFTESGRTQVWTSLIAAGALVVFWPIVRKRIALKKEQEAVVQSSVLEESHQ